MEILKQSLKERDEKIEKLENENQRLKDEIRKTEENDVRKRREHFKENACSQLSSGLYQLVKVL